MENEGQATNPEGMESAPRPAPSAPAPAPPARGGTSPLILGVLLLLVVSNGGLAYLWLSGQSASDAQEPAAPAAPATPEAVPAAPAVEGNGGPVDGAADAGNGQAAAPAACTVAEPVTLVNLDTFVVNLADERTQRFVRVTMAMEIANPQAAAFQRAMPEIRDRIIGLLSDRTSAEVRGRDGQQDLRRDIVENLNAYLCAVRTVYFTEFIVQ